MLTPSLAYILGVTTVNWSVVMIIGLIEHRESGRSDPLHPFLLVIVLLLQGGTDNFGLLLLHGLLLALRRSLHYSKLTFSSDLSSLGVA